MAALRFDTWDGLRFHVQVSNPRVEPGDCDSWLLLRLADGSVRQRPDGGWDADPCAVKAEAP